MRLSSLLFLFLLPGTVFADVYPPDGAHLLGGSGQVVLHWDLPGDSYNLVVTGAGRELFNAPVRGREFPLDVRAGTLYQWTVTPMGRPSAVPLTQTFQYRDNPLFTFSGTPGRQGTNWVHGDKTPSVDGGRGGDGQFVQVELAATPAGPLLTVERQKFLLTPDCPPVVIQARGGDGGAGGRGASGAAGSSPNVSPAYNSGGGYSRPYYYPGAADGGPGMPGGSGGSGGNGGRIQVRAKGLAPEKYLQFDVRGGVGGPGGQGGPGGLVAPMAIGVGRPGPDGQPGQDGPNGRDGTVAGAR